MKFEDLTPEQQEKAKACKTPEELVALAKEEGVELTDEQIEAMSGGYVWSCSDDCSWQCMKNIYNDFVNRQNQQNG